MKDTALLLFLITLFMVSSAMSYDDEVIYEDHSKLLGQASGNP